MSPLTLFPLVRANLGRHKRRTAFTMVSVALALFLFASLRSVVTTLQSAARFGSARRVVSMNATGFVFPLPLSYASRLSAMDGVEKVTWANWFGGRYGDGKHFFAAFAVDPESYLAVYPEIVVSPEHRAAFLQDRAGALVGAHLMDIFGWHVGQNVTLQGTIFPGDWTFTIRGTYKPTDPAIGEEALMFQHAMLDERTSHAAQAGWYILLIDKPDDAAGLAHRIDEQFRNSSAATKSGTEKAFNASFATMWGNVGLLMNSIGVAVVFAILLVAANAMMMSARERTAEVAVLKTIGFSDRALFALMMTEAGAITLVGAALGLGGARLLYNSTGFNAGGFLPGFGVTGPTLALGGAIALFLMLASGIGPAIRAARLPVVTALRTVE